MEMEVPIFKGCGKLLAAAKQVVSNWEHGDLAAAVRHLDFVIKEIEVKVTERPRDVILLIIELRMAAIFSPVKIRSGQSMNCTNLSRNTGMRCLMIVGKIPSDKLKAIELYYQEKEGEESYEMQALPLLSGRDED